MERTARYGPGGQMFICEDEAQVSKLEAAGWRDNPFNLDPAYKPDDAKWVREWGDLRIEEPAPVATKTLSLKRKIAE